MKDSEILGLDRVWRRRRRWVRRPQTVKEALIRAVKGQRSQYEDFWVLSDLSLSVQRGETIGFCGANGAGKSTLLRIVAGILPPTRGRVTLRGRVAALLELGDPLGLVSGEIARLDPAGGPPDGWHYLWHLGVAEIFDTGTTSTGRPCIDCEVEGDVGILQKEVDFPLNPDTEISWSWTVDALPGLLREDTVPSHDYLSLAIEFDNGWDLTYYWSAALPLETGYVCPLPNWKHREYHVVVRTGLHGLGIPCDERRNLHRDYGQFMAELGEAPTRIVKIWLIANSVFQRKLGRCRYSNIRLTSADRELVVL